MSYGRSRAGGPRRALAERALRAALELRASLGISFGEAVSIYDQAARLGIEVRFLGAPSLEGMYIRANGAEVRPLVVISSLRPAGRQASTAAHELGHHAFGHGTRIDEYVGETGDGVAASAADPEEILANAFGAFFLMPKAAVERGFRGRGYDPVSPSPTQVYEVAGWLGVGYGTLVHHMRWSLGLLCESRANALLGHQPKRIREEILGRAIAGDVMVVSSAWTGRPVDVQVGDQLLLPAGAATEGAALSGPSVAQTGRLTVEALSPGIAQVLVGEWAVFVRVSRRGYEGRGIYRHLEPFDDDESPSA